MTATTPVRLTMTPAQAAEFLGVKEWRVRKLIRSGELQASRVGGTAEHPRGMLIKVESLHAYINSLPAYAEAERGDS